VFNDTKVVAARLLFTKPTGGVIEVFCLEPADRYTDVTAAMLEQGQVWWKCLVGGAGKWKRGMVLEKVVDAGTQQYVIKAAIAERLSDCFVIHLQWQPAQLPFAELLHLAGLVPLPPYLHRQAEQTDKERYQTIYAAHDGSVAAPTAGLHFTENLFAKLAAKQVQKAFVTLHVGAGTFKPVKADNIAEHDMHTEFIEVKRPLIVNLKSHLDGTIVAVGTTSLRTIESLYWLGKRVNHAPGLAIDELVVDQWEPYDNQEDKVTAFAALEALLHWMEKNRVEKLVTKTRIMIGPGYTLRVARGLITNFHQPQSTLLLLIAAIMGDDWMRMYTYALENDFRFLSYGDGCLLWT
jgi:S-adenosylmethionine:tRNA ribosyltransferase-isomerase